MPIRFIRCHKRALSDITPLLIQSSHNTLLPKYHHLNYQTSNINIRKDPHITRNFSYCVCLNYVSTEKYASQSLSRRIQPRRHRTLEGFTIDNSSSRTISNLYELGKYPFSGIARSRSLNPIS